MPDEHRNSSKDGKSREAPEPYLFIESFFLDDDDFRPVVSSAGGIHEVQMENIPPAVKVGVRPRIKRFLRDDGRDLVKPFQVAGHHRIRQGIGKSVAVDDHALCLRRQDDLFPGHGIDPFPVRLDVRNRQLHLTGYPVHVVQVDPGDAVKAGNVGSAFRRDVAPGIGRGDVGQAVLYVVEPVVHYRSFQQFVPVRHIDAGAAQHPDASVVRHQDVVAPAGEVAHRQVLDPADISVLEDAHFLAGHDPPAVSLHIPLDPEDDRGIQVVHSPERIELLPVQDVDPVPIGAEIQPAVIVLAHCEDDIVRDPFSGPHGPADPAVLYELNASVDGDDDGPVAAFKDRPGIIGDQSVLLVVFFVCSIGLQAHQPVLAVGAEPEVPFGIFLDRADA